MRLIGLLSWYDEPPAALAAAVTSHARVLGLDALVAVDGAYDLYPGGRATSPPGQADTIARTCSALGVASLIHAPDGRWPGEPEKRSRLFDVAWAVSEPGDWWVILDGDHYALTATGGWRDQLETADEDAALVMFHEPQTVGPESIFPLRLMYRAQPLRCAINHFTYRREDGEAVWGNGLSGSILPALDLSDRIAIRHDTFTRPQHRQQDKTAYYRLRDRLGVERSRCDQCEQAPATRQVPHGWQQTNAGLAAGQVNVCEPCASKLERTNRNVITSLGYDPDQLRPTNRKVGAS